MSSAEAGGRRLAHGSLLLARAGRSIAGGRGTIRVVRREDGVLRVEVLDDITDGKLCRVSAEVEPTEIERVLVEVGLDPPACVELASGASSVHAPARVAWSVGGRAGAGAGAVRALYNGALGSRVEVRIVAADLVFSLSAERPDLAAALVDRLLPEPRPARTPVPRDACQPAARAE